MAVGRFVYLQALVGSDQAAVESGTAAFQVLVKKIQAAVESEAAFKALAGGQAAVARVSAVSVDAIVRVCGCHRHQVRCLIMTSSSSFHAHVEDGRSLIISNTQATVDQKNLTIVRRKRQIGCTCPYTWWPQAWTRRMELPTSFLQPQVHQKAEGIDNVVAVIIIMGGQRLTPLYECPLVYI